MTRQEAEKVAMNLMPYLEAEYFRVAVLESSPGNNDWMTTVTVNGEMSPRAQEFVELAAVQLGYETRQEVNVGGSRMVVHGG